MAFALRIHCNPRLRGNTAANLSHAFADNKAEPNDAPVTAQTPALRAHGRNGTCRCRVEGGAIRRDFTRARRCWRGLAASGAGGAWRRGLFCAGESISE